MTAQADAIADASRWLAEVVVDGCDAEELSRLVCEEPMVAALAFSMAVDWMRDGLEPEERGIVAQALKFSAITQLG